MPTQLICRTGGPLRTTYGEAFLFHFVSIVCLTLFVMNDRVGEMNRDHGADFSVALPVLTLGIKYETLHLLKRYILILCNIFPLSGSLVEWERPHK